MNKKIAICQPYFCPHIGYFKLINSVNLFVSYDDVNFIKGGWINRNKLLINGDEKLFTIPLIKQSSFKKINETHINWNGNYDVKLLKKIEQSYSKSKYKTDVLNIINDILITKPETIAELSLNSIVKFCEYLNIDTKIKVSSTEGYEKTDNRVLNLVNICKTEGINNYINPVGGMKLYNKEEFKQHDVVLNFIDSDASLSIIDVCMNKSKYEIIKDLNNFKLK